MSAGRMEKPVRYRPALSHSTSERPSTRFIAPFGGIAMRFGDDRDDSSSGFSIRCGRRWQTEQPRRAIAHRCSTNLIAARKEDEMRRDFAAILFSLLAGLALLATPPGLEARSASREDDRLNNSALVMKEAMGMQSGIPQSLLERAFCVIVIPSVIKGAFGVGGSYGRGA